MLNSLVEHLNQLNILIIILTELKHLMLGFSVDHINKFILNLLLKGIAKLNPHCIKQAEPVTPEILLKIADTFSHYKSIESLDPRGGTSLGHRVLISKIYAGKPLDITTYQTYTLVASWFQRSIFNVLPL